MGNGGKKRLGVRGIVKKGRGKRRREGEWEGKGSGNGREGEWEGKGRGVGREGEWEWKGSGVPEIHEDSVWSQTSWDRPPVRECGEDKISMSYVAIRRTSGSTVRVVVVSCPTSQ
ncbi:hypothetical protein Pmani_036064 [Petrolisthes manimaculis]|uniref:Uncharacterized protein n=1 Tax=Petrolisthes manimaculis TaxID=1843537 RepID=A0AAE1NKA9_9EUCA|nr:hypothetical protein Pmani_036064 [Petrolisthes manimaculis]